MNRWCPLVGLMIFAGGCLPLVDEGTAQVATNPFGAPAAAPTTTRNVQFAPAPAEVCKRVDALGRKLCADNPEAGLRPYFATIGSPSVEIFHKDTSMVFVTAGLVQHCRSEGELAAVLSLELGKMVAEREAGVNPKTRRPEGRPPITMPIGNAAYAGQTDLTHLAELGKFEKEHPRKARPMPRPDPQVLALYYLENAGFQKNEMDNAAPILQLAEQTFDFEKQFRGIPQGNWTP